MIEKKNKPVHIVIISLLEDILPAGGKERDVDPGLDFYRLGLFFISKGHVVTFVVPRVPGSETRTYIGPPPSGVIRLPLEPLAPVLGGELTGSGTLLRDSLALSACLDRFVKNCLEHVVTKLPLKNRTVIQTDEWISGACGHEICKQLNLDHYHSIRWDHHKPGRFCYYDNFKSTPGPDHRDNNQLDFHPMNEREVLRDAREMRIYRDARNILFPSVHSMDLFSKLYPEISRDRFGYIPQPVDENLFYPRVNHDNKYFF